MMHFIHTNIRMCLFLVSFLFISNEYRSQINDTLTFLEFREFVLTNHPVYRQALLQKAKGESTIQSARGNFDPKIEAGIQQKYFRDQDYYNLNSASLKIPTQSPIELKAGFDKNSGAYFNPENKTPNEGLLIAGASMPLLQGLIMDERRAALRQAQAFYGYSLAQQKIIVNNLLLSAYNQYWAWAAAFERVRISESIYTISRDRFRAVRERASFGDLAVIDTLEAFTQQQQRFQIFQEMRIGEIKERLLLSSFIWNSDTSENVGVILNESIAPEPYSELTEGYSELLLQKMNLINDIETTNPLLAQYEWKFKSLSIEEKLKKEKLKPKVNINYNFLSESISENANTNFSMNNYKWGLDFSFPILLRQGRGDLKLTRIKILETELELQKKTQDVTNKVRLLFETADILINQLTIARSNQKNYETLLFGERDKFFSGESSLFMVNQREQQFAESQFKVVDIQYKSQITANELSFQLGIIE